MKGRGGGKNDRERGAIYPAANGEQHSLLLSLKSLLKKERNRKGEVKRDLRRRGGNRTDTERGSREIGNGARGTHFCPQDLKKKKGGEKAGHGTDHLSAGNKMSRLLSSSQS